MKKLLYLLLLLNVQFLSSQIPNYVPLSGLQGFWPFNNNANDVGGNSYNGTVFGASLTNDRFNVANRAYNFNGSNAYILTNYAGILGTNPRAVSFWARTAQSTAIMTGVAWGMNGTAARYEAGFNYGAPGPMLDGGNGVITYNSPSPVFDNNWHHYVMQFGSSSVLNQVQIYQDGVLLTTTSSVYNGTNILNTISSFNVQFGRFGASPFHYFNGDLDDFGIWNRPLTYCEIQQLYSGIIQGVSASSNSVSCFGGNNGSATLSINCMSGPYSYTWMPNGGNSNTATGLTSGTYTYFVSAQNVLQSGTVAITQPQAISINLSASSPTSCTGNSITIQSSVNGGSGSYTYSWTNGMVSSSNLVSQNIAGSYTYSLNVTDLNGCPASQTTSVQFIAKPILSVSGTFTTCPEKPATLNAGGASTYIWNNNSTLPSITVSPITTTNYTVTGLSAGCSSQSVVTVVVIKCTFISSPSADSDFKIYPNPARDHLFIRGITFGSKVSIFNSYGIVMASYTTVSDQQVLDLCDYPEGCYFIKIFSGENILINRFIKE